MCGGTEMQEGRRPLLRIHVACEEIKHQSSFNPTCSNGILAKPALNINSPDYQKFKQSLARSGLLIRSPRRHRGPAAGCEGLGLAIVVAIQAALDESEETTLVESGVKCTAGVPVPPTSGTPATHTSPPTQAISSLAQQINPVPTPLSSIEENEVQASRGGKCKGHRLENAQDHDTLASRESIFALSPPNFNNPSSDGGHGLMLSPDFLKACLFCKRRLGPGKDTYMYRGDEAFCSTECRYKKIVRDERRERLSATACKGDQASTSNNHKHKNRILTAAS